MSMIRSAEGVSESPSDSRRETAHEVQRLVWDIPVRVFHWALVAAVIASYVTNKLGVAYFRYHVWCGYAVLILVGFRLLWGLVGTRHARFRNFLRGPTETLRYTRALLRGDDQHFAGHNPLGAIMVVVLMATLLTQAIVGLFSNDEIASVGPLYAYVSDSRSLLLTSLHRQLFDWIAIAIAVHVAAVLVHLLLKKERLLKAMWTGRKALRSNAANESIESSRLWLAALLIAALCGALAWIVEHAPAADIQAF
ncbi:MAG: cytochrome [Hydrocarboniphaga sp.]|uniref:cytochrome b/b6 domain-containing protein n=1 Tax=Hydrocarboniphaga sp. TaxID=2033016 RepID=UPI002622F885|nr:cytochrome b/b6 domain-containing protein [Hydrocarboniphaga sp.]MDB5970460.1 cytochrome [Hydrocarboniphaga sp.]